jgi:hypothetical protein
VQRLVALEIAGNLPVAHRPLLTTARVRGNRFTYILNAASPSCLIARLERRSHHRWRTIHTIKLVRTKGRHTVTLPRHRQGDRLVVVSGRAAVDVLTLR